jgi:hypothetical protein
MTDDPSPMEKLRARLNARGGNAIPLPGEVPPRLAFPDDGHTDNHPPIDVAPGGEIAITPHMADPTDDEIAHHVRVCAAVVPLFHQNITVRARHQHLTAVRPLRTMPFEQQAVVLWYFSGLKSGLISPRRGATSVQMDHASTSIFTCLVRDRQDYVLLPRASDTTNVMFIGADREGYMLPYLRKLQTVAILYDEARQYALRCVDAPGGWGQLARIVAGIPEGTTWATDR